MSSWDCREAPLIIRKNITTVTLQLRTFAIIALYCSSVIEVNLKAAHFKAGKTNYERVKNERLNHFELDQPIKVG